ncbi:Spherulin-4 [Mycena sanguinolenta]|uniref:Spherulin-4 n=1 Tax=Mycena sanguinolenta TaxID=230812 RepID=A0A8H6Z946_9AGAR|nr:Spherulin-4 [Mycena sanguinolenta]
MKFPCWVLSGCVWALSLAPCIRGLAAIVPLYWDPDSTCARWNSYFTIIDAHPSTTFYTIINPNQGPGVNGSQPRSGYQACVQSLRPEANPNAIVLGYVDIRVGTVVADIDTYAGWGDYLSAQWNFLG